MEDRSQSAVLIDDDGPAAGRLQRDVSPAVLAGATDVAVSARVYRRLGPVVTEPAAESVTVALRGPLPAGAYVRWRTSSKNPQVELDEATDTWHYRGEPMERRWSEWHRTDTPCRAVHVPARYRYNREIVDRPPFPLRKLESHRKGLCPHCFYGGPAGVNAAL